MYLKIVPYEEYKLHPLADGALLPYAAEDMVAGTVVRFERVTSGYFAYPATPDNPRADGVLLADTFAYGKALVAAKMTADVIEMIWVISYDDDDIPF